MKNDNGVVNKKSKKIIILLDVILIIVAIALAVSLVIIIKNKKEDNTNNFKFVSNQVVANIDETKMTEYSNKLLGIKFKYYNEFEKVGDVTQNSLFLNAGMYRNQGNEGINVLIGNVKETLSFEDYLYSHIYGIMESNNLKEKDIEIVKDNVKMGGLDSFKILYKSDDINFYQMMVQKDKKEYIMTYSAEDLYFDKQRAEDMFSTFEFLE